MPHHGNGAGGLLSDIGCHVGAVCPKGLTLTNDTSTCIDMGIVDVGKKVYNDPTLKKGINQTQVRSLNLQQISPAKFYYRHIDVYHTRGLPILAPNITL
jgi:hypothetical protein